MSQRDRTSCSEARSALWLDCVNVATFRGEGTMAAYLIAEHKIADPAAYEEYRIKALAAVDRFGGKLLLRARSVEALAGSWQPDRLVVLEFADMASLKAMHDSPDYQALIGIRNVAAANVLLAIEAA
ncbi:MAG: DUF1330 domain-containing protein [Mesorhizobium sp.]|nr:DUF1330 domain-containing protein [Mesorhizobium sp. M4B.F.Ca.ET.088.02.2.1]RVD24964.1 DUF1330 domain-containing protein [Mesorhizobium sp. M4B.F.Ca.ET.017.02.2.1]RWF32399.1 MAG: DUF1330 domain-containing protein [Mesorhizobium sp.]RWF43956.1 MAG: DUF1330 domain-containing protein [Mesorhizobium sp.]TIX38230.1 MAG: DUF1330 domain-containing protein [Mesorhizobium sp.]